VSETQLQLEGDWDTFRELETAIAGAETVGIRARWNFGQRLLTYESKPGSKHSPLRAAVNMLSREFGVSEAELYFRRQFADDYPTEENLSNALERFGSWFAIVERGLGERQHPRPTIEPPPAPTGTYQVVYADPPWRYEQPGGQTPELRAVERHYPTMTDDEIADLEPPAAPDSICFLWATNPKLREALHVLDAWDFTYRTNLAWVKDQIGMGYYVRGQHELLLIGKRGDFPVPGESVRPPSVLHAPRARHSEKPEQAYELIEAMYPTASRIELFARGERAGWERWGAIAA
jgi:N6-adenosine-specific RNA methylase IME4